jgi:hypothetical protein
VPDAYRRCSGPGEDEVGQAVGAHQSPGEHMVDWIVGRPRRIAIQAAGAEGSFSHPLLVLPKRLCRLLIR